MKRTHNNGELGLTHVGQSVELIGWVAKKRNLGAICFIDLRDRYGITQLVADEEKFPDVRKLRNEFLINIKGVVNKRKDANKQLATGEIDVSVSAIEIINSSETTPLIIADETDALEEVRLKYRYLDLRRPVIQQKIIDRSRIQRIVMNYLDNLGFTYVETPLLTISTPEGARDYVVPSRVQNGKFYALPQSPQLFKQLLMISGMEKYYQIARCFRDEDLRADRQPDFTQIDVEMSFIEKEDIYHVVEQMMKIVLKQYKNIDLPTPFVKMSYKDALNIYGVDKPDMRFELKIADISKYFQNTKFTNFHDALAQKGSIKVLRVSDIDKKITRKVIDKINEIAKSSGGNGVYTLRYENGFESNLGKELSQELDNLNKDMHFTNGDTLFIATGLGYKPSIVLGQIRLFLGQFLELIKDEFRYLWVDDFPLFEKNEEGRIVSSHHPFTMVKKESLPNLDKDPLGAVAESFDLVLNGYELLSGSLRIYQQELQTKIFSLLGLSQAEIEEKFGFFLKAFKYGTPPHGGFAIGFDRLVMILTGASNIKEVIAFPKNNSAVCPLTEAPGVISDKQLGELGINFKKS